MTKARYEPARTIDSLDELDARLRLNLPHYWHGRITPAGFLLSVQFRALANSVRYRHVAAARLKEKS